MKKLFALLFCLTFILGAAGCSSGGGNNSPGAGGSDEASEEQPVELAGDLDAREIIAASCVSCHGDGRIYRNQNKDDWPPIVERMGDMARISDEEKEAVLIYLQENYSN